MNLSPVRSLNRLCVLALSLALTACSVAPHRPQPAFQEDVLQRAQAQQGEQIQVRVSVPSQAEAEALFGIPLHQRGIQPVWLEITNRGDARARTVLASIDREYFPPMEVAYMFRKRFSKGGWMDLERYLFDRALPRMVHPGQTVSGFVFTHQTIGTKAINVNVHLASAEPTFEQFIFFIEVPGFVPDHASVDFERLYAPDEVRTMDADGLRTMLTEVPCCTANRAGDAEGRPVNLVFVAQGRDLLQALLRAGWTETAYDRDERYLDLADHLLGRPPDAIFRKGRDRDSHRLDLSLWLSPYLVDGVPVWFAVNKHAIGRRYPVGEWFFGAVLDPDLCGSRDYIIQDLWYGQAVEQWAFSMSGRSVPSDAPETDFNGHAWFTRDPYRAVVWISGSPIAMSKARSLRWDGYDDNEDEAP